MEEQIETLEKEYARLAYELSKRSLDRLFLGSTEWERLLKNRNIAYKALCEAEELANA